jgi:hypothetical protein
VVRGTAAAIARMLKATGGTVINTASIERLNATSRSALAPQVAPRTRLGPHRDGADYERSTRPMKLYVPLFTPPECCRVRKQSREHIHPSRGILWHLMTRLPKRREQSA